MIITAVERKRGRAIVYIDGEIALEMGVKLAEERGIAAGRSVTPAEVEELAQTDMRQRAMGIAVRLLSYRQRSVHELRDRLRRKDIDSEVIDATIARLKELGYVDDAAFARSWAEMRLAASPRSARLLASELRLRGIAPSVAIEATAEVTDDEAAYRAAAGRMRSLRKLDYKPFRERLGRFLTSRGFSYGVARETIERCWSESGHGTEDAGID